MKKLQESFNKVRENEGEEKKTREIREFLNFGDLDQMVKQSPV